MKEALESLVREMIEKHIRLDEAVSAFEKKFVQTVLASTKGNQCKAAEILGIHRNSLSRKIAVHKLNGKG